MDRVRAPAGAVVRHDPLEHRVLSEDFLRRNLHGRDSAEVLEPAAVGLATMPRRGRATDRDRRGPAGGATAPASAPSSRCRARLEPSASAGDGPGGVRGASRPDIRATLLLHDGLRKADVAAKGPASRYRRDVVGWLVWKLIAPSNGLRTRTIKAWVPAAGESPETVMADFARLQSEMIGCVREADQLPIDRVTVRSPYDARLTCDLYAALTLIPRHQQRHVAAGRARRRRTRFRVVTGHRIARRDSTAPLARPASIRQPSLARRRTGH